MSPYLAMPLRPFPIALAQVIVAMPAGSPRRLMLDRLYRRMLEWDRLVCRLEALECNNKATNKGV